MSGEKKYKQRYYMNMPNFISKTHHYFLALLFIGLTACSSVPPQRTSNNLGDKIQQTRVVLVGENHTDYGHHLNQLAVIKKTHEKFGLKESSVISIGLEMVQQPFQHYLDDYISGKITELEMLRGVEWYSRWRYDFRLYRPIFDYAKQNKIPLIALNIPQELTKRISKVGIDGLTPEERKHLPAFIDKSNTQYTARLRKIFGMHARGKTLNEKGFNKFVDAQLAWDEGMAFTAAKYLKKHPKKRMVVLAGSGHIINRAGIPSRLDRQLQLTPHQRSLVILSHSEEQYTPKEADISLPTRDIKLPPAGLIGIGMNDSSQGVQISNIAKSGAAQKAGLQKGDLLLKLNEVAVETTSDVNLWRLDKKPNEKVAVLVRRENQLIRKTLVLGDPTN